MWNYIIIIIHVNDILFCRYAGYKSDANITVYFIGYHIFFTLLPSCYCEGISLGIHSHDQHILPSCCCEGMSLDVYSHHQHILKIQTS